MKQIIAIVFLLVFLWACRGKDRKAEQAVMEEEELMTWKENDTLSLQRIPEGLALWLQHYRQVDTAFTLNRFRASGVVLHFGGLQEAIARQGEEQFREYHIYSPDSSSYIDLHSYDHFMDKGLTVEGEADQQVVLANSATGDRKQLLFSGPSESADVADWLGNGSFLIGLRSTSENGKAMNASILVFNLADSTFTSFNLDHGIAMDAVIHAGPDFTGSYMKKLKDK